MLAIGCSNPAPTKITTAEPTQPKAVAPKGASPVAAAIALGTSPMAVDEAGVPRLLLGTTIQNLQAATPAASARAYVTRLAAAWGVKAVPVLDAIGDVPVRGGTITRLRATIDGTPVAGELRVLVRDDGTLGAVGGKLFGSEYPRSSTQLVDDDAGAVARAIGHAYKTTFDRKSLTTRLQRSNGNRTLRGRSGNVDVQLAAARKVWYPTGDALVAAWVVEAYAQDARATTTWGDAWRTIIDREGKVLKHDSIVADANFNYRVFADETTKQPLDGPQTDFSPHPTGTPNGAYPTFVPPVLVQVDGLNHGGVQPDPWLVAGKLETNGNHVDAYADIISPSGFSNGDFRASATAAGTFDRTYDTAAAPKSSVPQQMAAITSAFYGLNYLHDFWYDSGFTETAGNAQDNNYGRGGEDRDAMFAETQDFSGTNNANMSTPRDGLPPRMQIYTWSGRGKLTVSGRTPQVGTAAFGPSFDLTGQVVLANDGNTTTPAGSTVSDGCTALSGVYTGKIVLVDRGQCSFKTKTLMAQQAGAIGVIITNVSTTTNPQIPANMGDDATITTPITIGTLSVNLAEGDLLKAEIAGGAVTAAMSRDADYDGSLDSTLLAHEYGHYVHHRLSECGTTLCSAMSEGWGDFLALMQLARPGDNFATGAYPFSVYVTRSFSADPGYFGIRRAPYSASPAINSLSFRHMTAGEALPTTHPFLPFGVNNEVHNAGEIWAAALWQGYVALQGAGGTFADNHRKMADYVVSGLLLMAPDVTPTEARDAILAAAYAASPADHDLLATAFASRGFGSCAVSPPRDSVDFVGIQEGTEVKGRAVLGAVALVDSVDSCDNDGVLDGGETARITVPVSNGGPVAITNVVATLTTTNADVTIAAASVTIASIPAYSSMDVTFDVSLANTATAPVAGDFTLAVTADGNCVPSLALPITPRLNTDDHAMTAATDTFDAAITPWTPTGTEWRLARDSALDGVFHGDAPGATSDHSVETPR
ncbi:MAG: M36 family metallopeptidase [Kofleriaceae bacterium]